MDFANFIVGFVTGIIACGFFDSHIKTKFNQPKNSVFKYGDIYYTVVELGNGKFVVDCRTYINGIVDQYYIKIGRAFITSEAAQAHANKLNKQ